jgi:hypothetical protein
MKKITSVYYLSYPDSPPPDPKDAESIVVVELGTDKSTTSDFETTRSLKFITKKRLDSTFDKSNFCWIYLEKSIVIEEFSDTEIFRVLDDLLPEIDRYSLPE